jgi:hypothetical protein
MSILLMPSLISRILERTVGFSDIEVGDSAAERGGVEPASAGQPAAKRTALTLRNLPA